MLSSHADEDLEMTRDEHRDECIEAIALAVARNMFPEHNLKKLDELGPRLARCYRDAGQDGLDALHGIARVCPIEATDETIYTRPHSHDVRDHGNTHSWVSIEVATDAGDLTNPQGGNQ